MEPVSYFIKAESIGWQTKVEDDFPYFSYTEYMIRIKTSKSTWVITKRYSDFEKLNASFNLTELLNIFPEKVWLNTLDSVIEHRSAAFERYLNFLFFNISVPDSPHLLDFISVYREQFLIFATVQKLYQSTETNPRTDDSRTSSFWRTRASTILLDTSSCDTNYIANFLEKINSNEDFLSKHVEKFSIKFGSFDWKLVSKREIKQLLFGNELVKGLFCFIDGSQSRGEKAIIKLLAKLTSQESNENADDFRETVIENKHKLKGIDELLEGYLSNVEMGREAEEVKNLLENCAE